MTVLFKVFENINVLHTYCEYIEQLLIKENNDGYTRDVSKNYLFNIKIQLQFFRFFSTSGVDITP